MYKRQPESLRLINSIFDEEDKINEVELGKYYGSLDKKNIRIVFNEELLHPFQPYNIIATANQLSFFDNVFDSPKKLDPFNQIWFWKELFTLLNMIIGFIMIIPLTKYLLNISYFKILVKKIPTPLPPLSGKSKTIFWLIFIISGGIASLTFIPMVDIAKELFPEAANRQLTWYFPQRMNNSVMLWAMFNGIIGIILFYISYNFFGKKNGVVKKSWGLDITKKELLRTFLLGLLVFACYYIILYLIYFIFHVDYRFWFMGVRIFQPKMLIILLMYAPFFFVFFFSNSLRVNGGMRFQKQPEWLSKLVAGFANSVGLLLIIVVQYFYYYNNGIVFWTDNWLSVNLLFGLVPMMFILPYFNRIFFQMTGRVYLGPIITCLIFIMILSTNTVIYLPI